MKIRDNNFSLKMMGMTNVVFNVTDHYITSGQGWEGVTVSDDSEGCIFLVRAGRKGSSAPADWFKNKVTGGNAIACDTLAPLPSKLNFAFIGDLSFEHGGNKYSGTDIVIAQGHNARSRNNWWLGGKHMSEITDLPLGIYKLQGQPFKESGGVLPDAIVTFGVKTGCVSNMSMGILGM
ncbi:hypothetical protein [Xenorhabdus hominickii]|uniref:Uncharacterized protein n=1 Tax=Xenorhabdus hominickii TaxID=351679 RepID=A0A2G0Q3F2_XENHO|nr:hypothetical protein [Xenorhabdus hominickii]AOM39945.1 hypothetical protein A9255_04770 [Xenorhabdus hominickii]PHM53730.1 hypothetical protein Xhom_03731 [Xenorhabdus hominickii]